MAGPLLVPIVLAASSAIAEPPNDDAQTERHPLLESEVQLGAVSRQLTFTDAIDSRLHPYSVVAPLLSGESRWYPAGHVTDGTLGNLGLVARYEVGLPPSTAAGVGARTRQFRAGFIGRLPFEHGQVTVSGQWGRHEFGVDRDPVRGRLVPDVRYEFVRLGLGARLFFGRWVADLDVATRFIDDAGPIASEEWFPRAAAGGLDATLMGGMALGPFDLLLGVRHERYFFALYPDPDGDNPAGVAAGALDAYTGIFAGLRFSLSRR